MSSNVLHIKDSYYFEVPKSLWRSHREDRDDFPDYWVRLDPDYQNWEADKLYDVLAKSQWIQDAAIPAKATLIQEYHAWRDTHKNFAKPFTTFLKENQELEWFQEMLGTDQAQEAWSDIQATPISQGYLSEYKKSAPPGLLRRLRSTTINSMERFSFLNHLAP